MVLAQSNTQETDGTIYTAEVIQIDGSKKVVTYHRDIRWVIIAPPVTDGKLVDGNEAPNNPVEARVAQKKILVKYDRSSLTMLAMVWPKDLIKEAFEDIKIVSDLVEKWRPVTKEQIQKRLLGLNILILSWEKVNEQMKLTDVIATTQLKMSASEINRMKHETELKAIQIWKSTTGAVVAE